MDSDREPGGGPDDPESGGLGPPEWRGPAREVGQYLGHGVTLGLGALLFAWLGHLLDGRLTTSPLFLLLGLTVGFGAGFYSMYRRLTDTLSDEEDEASADEDGP